MFSGTYKPAKLSLLLATTTQLVDLPNGSIDVTKQRRSPLLAPAGGARGGSQAGRPCAAAAGAPAGFSLIAAGDQVALLSAIAASY